MKKAFALAFLFATQLAPFCQETSGKLIFSNRFLEKADGSGTYSARVNPGQGQVCYELSVSRIDPATAAHIHAGDPTVAGPVVVPLEAPADGSSEACASVERDLAQMLIQSPEDYYVNVHNAAFPQGAIRGQLSK
jgi:hypothetical protein